MQLCRAIDDLEKYLEAVPARIHFNQLERMMHPKCEELKVQNFQLIKTVHYHLYGRVWTLCRVTFSYININTHERAERFKFNSLAIFIINATARKSVSEAVELNLTRWLTRAI